ncbi:MAG: transposase family protein [Hymenobacter sp.]
MVKKFYTLKWLLVCTLDKRILFVSKAYSGHTHDFTIFKYIFGGLDLSAYRLHVDAGFMGIKKAVKFQAIWIPYKASKNKPLNEWQKLVNKLFAHVRIVIENVIAKIKSFFILRIENRTRQKIKFASSFQLCAALANFKTIIYQLSH